MPKRTDIHSILIIGSGPIVIGQGCEFDYSGVQACRALREEGFRIVLINSNPATIMTDPQFADATYIEPISPEAVEKILAREKAQGTPVDAILPTLGGQTGLNVGMACYDQGILAKYDVKMIGADRDAIHRGEDRQVFKDLMIKIGLKVPRSGVVHNMDDARKVLADIGLPLIIRPAFTLGGTGGGIAYNVDEFETIVARGLDASPVTEVLIEESVIGWKEFELEVVRDKNDNCIIVCSIENIDPMGVHTGDSITVAPIQTLTDKEYQRMRDAAFAVIRAVGVETGGSNIQFATNPENGDMVVVEMNPRVSRSSALASKATGYPIAKIAAKLAVGYTLDELPNPITSRKKSQGASSLGVQSSTQPDWELYTSACFEPTIDYCVIKIPRFTFEKFPDADETLTTQMKSVGEAMAIGRTFKEALQKGIRSMEVKRFGFGLDSQDAWLNAQNAQGARSLGWPIAVDVLRGKLSVPNQNRLYYIRYALKMGWTIDQIHELTKIDRWFLAEMEQLTDFEGELASDAKRWFADSESNRWRSNGLVDAYARKAKQLGYSDVQLSTIWNSKRVRDFRDAADVLPVYKLVDTCAAEFEAATPYYYSSYENPFVTVDVTTGKMNGVLLRGEDEIRLTNRPKIIIIGGGPNRIGQGIEFDYCCVQAAFALKELGIESVMINSNPETVSTDYDTSDLLFFEPLTHEDVLNVCERLNGRAFSLEVVDLTIDDDGYSLLYVGQSKGSELPPPGIPADWKSVVGAEAKRRNLGSLGLVQVGSAGTIRSLSMVDAHRTLWSFDFDQATSKLTGVQSDRSADWMWSNVIDANTAKRIDQFVSRHPNLVRGVIVQFGGQTPLNLARGLHDVGVPIIGTSIDMLEAAGDREKFRTLVEQIGLKQPENGIARSVEDARKIAAKIGYPVLVRPSFVLGGRAMEIVSDEAQLNHYMAIAVKAEGENPILVDKFLDHAIECDVDCIADYRPPAPVLGGEGRGEGPSAAGGVAFENERRPSPQRSPPITREREYVGRSVICGVMEHIEEAGIHSGDSACSLPPHSFSPKLVQRLKDNTHQLAAALKVNGLMNVQYAIKDDEIYLIEVNPRASRTIPFVGKATGVPWAKLAAKVMAGKTLDELNVHELPDPKHVSVKEVVFPFSKFPGVDVILGPEMRSTGEVMGIATNFPRAYAKAQIAAGNALPLKGAVYVSVNDRDKQAILPIARQLHELGFTILASAGTGKALVAERIPFQLVPKLSEGRPNIIDRIKNGDVQLIINTPTRKGRGTDEGKIRGAAVMNRVPIVTTLTGAHAATLAIAELQNQVWTVQPLQAYFAK